MPRVLLCLVASLMAGPVGVSAASGTVFIGWTSPAPSPSDAGPHEHCWHAAGFTHAVGVAPDCFHTDDFCCRCGHARCQTTCYAAPDRCTSHGEFLPGCEHPDGGSP